MTLESSAFEATNLLGQWQGVWIAQVGRHSAHEPVVFSFAAPGKLFYATASHPTAMSGSFSVQEGEIIIQFGADDFIVLRNVQAEGRLLKFEVGLTTLENLSETNSVMLTRTNDMVTIKGMDPTNRAEVARLAQKYALPLAFPLWTPLTVRAERMALENLLQDHIETIVQADPTFANYESKHIQVKCATNSVQVFVVGKPEQTAHDRTYNALLQARVAEGCLGICGTNYPVSVSITSEGLGAFSAIASPNLKSKYLEGKEINHMLLWDECLTVARKACAIDFDSSTFSSDSNKQLKISSVLRPVQSGLNGVLAVERLTLTLSPLKFSSSATTESVTLSVDYEQLRRRAASRTWQTINAREERLLSGGTLDDHKRATQLEADELVLAAILKEVCERRSPEKP